MFYTTSPKRNDRPFDEIFVTGYTKNCENDNFRRSHWQKFHQKWKGRYFNFNKMLRKMPDTLIIVESRWLLLYSELAITKTKNYLINAVGEPAKVYNNGKSLNMNLENLRNAVIRRLSRYIKPVLWISATISWILWRHRRDYKEGDRSPGSLLPTGNSAVGSKSEEGGLL